jgi:hypothetical protein
LSEQAAPSPTAEYLIAALRCARLRVLLLANEMDEVGVSLKHKMISPQIATEWLQAIGADGFMTGGGERADAG